MNYGFVKVATAIPSVKVADCIYNAQQIEELIAAAEDKDAEIISFPELSITGYSCGDLLAQNILLEEAETALIRILENTRRLDIIGIVGMPVRLNSCLLNTAVVFQRGRILGVVPKTYLPNYREFCEQRWFTSGQAFSDETILLSGQQVTLGSNLLFETPNCCFGIEICEDMWATIPPGSTLALKGAEIIFNLCADNEGIGKNNYLRSLISQQSARCLAGYVLSSCGFGESTTDVVLAGNAFIYENGTLLSASQRFCMEPQLLVNEIDMEILRSERRINTTFAAGIANVSHVKTVLVNTETVNEKEFTLTRKIEQLPFVPSAENIDTGCEEAFAIQVSGLAKRLIHTNCHTAVIGISGGLDSTLALLVCVQTFDNLKFSRKGIIGITMPGFGTTDHTYNNALLLMKSLGVTIREISIKDSCTQHFKDIGHDINIHDVTYENAQARERTQILMDVANQVNGMVIGTGDLSELALGWATYNGDHMSMYGVNAGVPKTLIQYLVNWIALNKVSEDTTRTTLLDIVDTPISPELIPADEQGNIKQKTEDLVGPYELHDFFLYYFLRHAFRPSKIFYLARIAFKNKYTEEIIKKWLTTFFRRFFNQQFKRSCLPDGPKIGSVSLSPRGDWKMPSDASSVLWLKECDSL